MIDAVIEQLIDTKRYPLHHLNSERVDRQRVTALVDRCRRELAQSGAYQLDGLVHPAAVQRIAAALQPTIAHHSFEHDREHNIYFDDELDELPSTHPALRRFRTTNRTLGADQLGHTDLATIYRWAPLRTFLAATLGLPGLYPMAGPLGSMNVMAYGAGQALGWHFDRSEFTTTLLLQAPDAGGEFEYRTHLRSDHDPNYDGVARLLLGADPDVRALPARPGTLTVFRGANTAHRATAVEGSRQRVISAFSYHLEPDVMLTDIDRRGFYGRAEPA